MAFLPLDSGRPARESSAMAPEYFKRPVEFEADCSDAREHRMSCKPELP
jgi:hypothetical protein